MANPIVLAQVFQGLPLSGGDLNNNWSLVENSFMGAAPYILSGLVPSAGAGLSVNVTAGTAVVGVYQALQAFVIGSLADNTTNFLYLLETGTGFANTSGTQPANSVILGKATTAGGVVTAVNTGRASGRQQLVLPQNLIPGGPAAGATSAGHPASINLANWAASAAEGVAVFGTLPGGAVAGPSTLDLAEATKSGNYTLTGSDSTIFADTTAGNVTLTLPTAVGVAGRIYCLKNIGTGANTLTIATTGGQTIDGASGAHTTVPQAALILQSDGSNWQTLGRN